MCKARLSQGWLRRYSARLWSFFVLLGCHDTTPDFLGDLILHRIQKLRSADTALFWNIDSTFCKFCLTCHPHLGWAGTGFKATAPCSVSPLQSCALSCLVYAEWTQNLVQCDRCGCPSLPPSHQLTRVLKSTERDRGWGGLYFGVLFLSCLSQPLQ